jgi:hypothetical protein
MEPTNKVARRLALLKGINLSQAYLDAILAELEDLDRIVGELEEFAEDTPWVSHQNQPAGSKG